MSATSHTASPPRPQKCGITTASAAAFATAGSTDSAAVIDALQKSDYKDGIAGEITFREDHTLARSNFIVLEGKGGAWALAQY